MRKLRVFYRKSDNHIVWYHETRSLGGVEAICPSTISEDLATLPSKMPDGETSLGGAPSGYGCIEAREADIEAYFASDTNEVVNGELKIGEPRLQPEPDLEPPRDLVAEIDELKIKVEKLEKEYQL